LVEHRVSGVGTHEPSRQLRLPSPAHCASEVHDVAPEGAPHVIAWHTPLTHAAAPLSQSLELEHVAPMLSKGTTRRVSSTLFVCGGAVLTLSPGKLVNAGPGG
jgi:hypothetical protein